MGDAEARVQAAVLAPIGDSSSRSGAERLKRTIEAAWIKRGKRPPLIQIVETFVVVAGERVERFELRSNMRNGQPS